MWIVLIMFYRQFIRIIISNDTENINYIVFQHCIIRWHCCDVNWNYGVGKRTACNFLLGEKIFDVGQGMIPVTSKSGEHTVVVNSRELKIIDTPGFCKGNEKDEEEDLTELGKAILFARDGVHAIGLVINASQQVTSSQMTLLKELELFGELWSFMFIIFTAAKGYGDTEKEQRNAIDKIHENPRCPETVIMLLDKVDKRYIVLESTDTSPGYKAKKLRTFLKWLIGYTTPTKGFTPTNCLNKLLNYIRKKKKKHIKNRSKYWPNA